LNGRIGKEEGGETCLGCCRAEFYLNSVWASPRTNLRQRLSRGLPVGGQALGPSLIPRRPHNPKPPPEASVLPCEEPESGQDVQGDWEQVEERGGVEVAGCVLREAHGDTLGERGIMKVTWTAELHFCVRRKTTNILGTARHGRSRSSRAYGTFHSHAYLSVASFM